jgi:uncharacterized protein (TIGR02302 family)
LTDRFPGAAAPPQVPAQGRSGRDVLARALERARWTILWERLWPALASLATVIGLFLAASWLGLWLWLPATGRAIGLGVFFLLAAAAFAQFLMLRLPSRTDGLKRLDRNSGLPHRPATAIADEIAAPAKDSYAVALWRAHVERALRAAKTLKAGTPTPRLALRDPLALRVLVAVLVVATFVAAGGERMKRIAAAFDWQGVIVPANFRIDAWVSPPTYTGRPPLILPGLRPGEPAQTAAAVAVPAGSTLIIRATGIHLDVVASGGVSEAASAVQTVGGNATEERRFVISEAGAATVRGIASSDVGWQFTAIPDKPPTIALAKDPEGQARGALLLAYKLEDDYGVVGAQATFKLANEASNGRAAHPLYDAPDFSLGLPQARTRNGVGQTTKDLTEHPWAGVDVTMTLIARDEAGNQGQSAPFEFRLPERPFAKPMARALIEQRRLLALDGDAQANALNALAALTLAPERFNMEANVYLGLRSIYWQLARAKSDDQLREVVARMWDMAVHLEDGSISDAEQALRAAEEALRQALERGASDEELKRLTDQLRAALDKFLQALAEQLRRNPQQLARPLDPNARQLRPQDLRNMIDRLEQMARSGAKDAARRMLQELQSMLENLQMARPGQQMDGDDDMMSALDELGDMIRKQQQLRDRTFQQGQDQRRQRGQRGQPGQQGQQGQEGQQGDQMGELRENQQALRNRLKELMEQLRKHGLGQEQGQQGKGEMDQLGRAGEAMGEAEGQLGEGNADGAVDSQGRALEALRRGAQNLAQSMQQQGMMGPGPNGQPGRLGQPRAQQDTDPLGRPLRGRDYGDDTTVKVPGEIDVQRARRILEELRRRFGENFRPQLELEYIERLLRDF